MLNLDQRLSEAQAEGLEPNVLRWLAFLGVAAGDVVELQALGVPARYGKPQTRYAHATSSADVLRLLSEAERWPSPASGLYMIANRCDPRVAARSEPNKWHVAQQGHSTSDRDILARRVLPIDLDVERPSGISATDAEVALAFEVAHAVVERLVPVVGLEALAVGHSGNGVQILVSLDAIPEEPEVLADVKAILAALAALHATDAIKVDCSLCDAKRILPAWGTMKRKGAHTDVRPHRRTGLIRLAEAVQTEGQAAA